MAILYKGLLSTFRTLGVASANHNVFTLWNKTGSTRIAMVERLVIQVDDSGVLTSVSPPIIAARISALPTGGTVLTPVARDSNLTHDTNIEAMGATASDGGTGTTITATAGTRAWTQFKMRAATAVGQYLFPDESMLPKICETDPFVLRAGEGVVVQVVAASVTTAHYIVNCAYREEG